MFEVVCFSPGIEAIEMTPDQKSTCQSMVDGPVSSFEDASRDHHYDFKYNRPRFVINVNV